ncbi:MAG TPA: sulfotransferase [Mycobacteriales bacterium]|nr:sulfotransferase [Mycobacteriales bacterium]
MSEPGAPHLPVFVLAESAESGEQLRAALGRMSGWSAPTGVDLPSRLARLFWGHESGQGEAGVSALVDHEHLMHALRRLADSLVAAALRPGSSVFVDVVADAELLGPYVRLVWPDAVVVAVAHGVPSDRVAAASPDLVVTDRDVTKDPRAVAARVAAVAAERIEAPPRWARLWPRRVGSRRARVSDSELRDRLVVVLGAARSGTTWLHRLLCASPLIAGTETGETWLFPDIAPVWADQIRALAGDNVTLSAMRAFCDDLLVAMRDRVAPGATHVCEKTPTTAWQLPVLARLYPDARYVHIVRDGRDAALSLSLTRGDGADLAGAAQEWVEAVSAIRLAAGGLRRFTQVRYEDLLADPSAVTTGLWSWLGVPSSEPALTELRTRATQRVTPLPASGEIGSGKWRSLPAAERAALDSLAGPLLRELGYDEADS